MNVRRYYLLKMRAARSTLDRALASTWQAKHDAEPGTPLVISTPGYSRLVAAGYTSVEDLDGATVAELVRETGVSRREAEAALAALE